MSETTKATRSTANPRRTTLASVADFAELPGFGDRTPRAYAAELPAATANPRRTVLMTAPATRLPQD
ncbi:hypothetical protein [Kitasatospora cheerisanensis]|uniref:Uncharacterized protein n=1 Tax=Kitasatospora cheerisanensis KCTC 2395 TaxID=1348663 RepID=A0A066YSR3_9ACTN|nr:hypothetical protein [Kitasatospora cheerisanensis]KDN83029.1 hypothetical protein KCH_51750 [Kitasatospora cheerisanensis KCTC 2395]